MIEVLLLLLDKISASVYFSLYSYKYITKFYSTYIYDEES